MKPKSMGMHYLNLEDLSKLIEAKEVSPIEITKEYLNRIEKLEPKLNSFITILHDYSLEKAKDAEKEILNGYYRGALHGIPYSIKDLFFTKDIRTTMGSKIYDSFIPNYNSAVGNELEKSGAILIGKTNLHPFAYGATGENLEYGHMHNPWNIERIAGGSSGGSASSVASDQCVFSIGSDTGGSVRAPAGLCNIVGLKPTYGLISREGVAGLSWGQDHPGPMTRNVKDCALVMNAITGYYSIDSNSGASGKIDYTTNLNGDIKGIKIGIPNEIFKLPINDEVNSKVLQAIKKLEELGAIIKEVSWPMFDKAMAIANIIQMVEATSYYRDMIIENGSKIYEPARMRFDSGFFVSGLDYIQAQRARVLFIKKSMKMMKDVDLVVTPSTPVPAFKLDTPEYEIGGEKRNVVALLSQYTRPFNLNGFPAISVPCGFASDGLPIGLQIAGKPFNEAKVIQAAYAYEQSVKWSNRRPSI